MIRKLLCGLLLLASSSAMAVTCVISFTFSGGGSGTVSFQTGTCGPSTPDLATVTNFQASFTTGPSTWDQSQMSSKYGTQPFGNLFFSGTPTDVVWDDPDNGSGDSSIVVFTNGGNVLSFDEGDLGGHDYRINGVIAGTYLAQMLVLANAPVPTMSQIGLLLMGLLLAAGAALRLRKLSK